MTRSWCTPLSISLAYFSLGYIYWDTFIAVEFLGQFTCTIWKFLTHVAQLPSKWLLFHSPPPPDSVPGSKETHQLLAVNDRSIMEKQMEPAQGPRPHSPGCPRFMRLPLGSQCPPSFWAWGLLFLPYKLCHMVVTFSKQHTAQYFWL